MGCKDFFPWVEIPLHLFGKDIYKLKEKTGAVSLFMREVGAVFLETIPTYLLQLVRYLGILQKQRRAQEIAQVRMTSVVFSGLVFVTGMLLKLLWDHFDLKDASSLLEMTNGTHALIWRQVQE